MIGDPHPLTPMNPCMRRRGEGVRISKIVRLELKVAGSVTRTGGEDGV